MSTIARAQDSLQVSPGLTDDVTVQQGQLRIRPCTEDEVHMAGDVSANLLRGFFGRPPSTIQVLDNPEDRCHLRMTVYRQSSKTVA